MKKSYHYQIHRLKAKPSFHKKSYCYGFMPGDFQVRWSAKIAGRRPQLQPLIR